MQKVCSQPGGTDVTNTPGKHWAHVLTCGPMFSRLGWVWTSLLPKDMSIFQQQKGALSWLFVCLLRFPRENWAVLSDRSHRLHTLGAGKRTVLIVHVFPVATHQLSRAEGSCMYSGVYSETWKCPCKQVLPSAGGGNSVLCWWFTALKNFFVCLLWADFTFKSTSPASNTDCGDFRSRSKRLSPPIRKSSPATYCMSSCCLQQPSTPMIHPNRMMETAMPMKPAVILRRSEERERRKARKKTWRWWHPDRTAREESRQI